MSLNLFSVKRAGFAVRVLWGVHGLVQHGRSVTSVGVVEPGGKQDRSG